MTNEQEIHLLSITERFKKLADAKYQKGQKEHGGNLWDLSATQLLDEAIAESIDQITYLLTLRDKLNQI